jgi:Type VII secretion system ESX-1, transport TM domain B
LLTEPGVVYPVPPEAVNLLGYEGIAPLRLPSSIVARVPMGPSLDPAAAALPVATSQ